MNIKLGRAYRHVKSGKEVLTQELAKSKINGEWVDSVIYSVNGDKYVRTVEDFLSHCDLITTRG